MYCNVLVTQPFDNTFTYKIPSNQIVKPGNIVKVPFGKKKDQIGVVYELCDKNVSAFIILFVKIEEDNP